MKKSTRVWLITAASLVLSGCILFAGVMSAIGWDFSKLSTVRYETNTHEVFEPFSDISLATDTADIVFAPSDDGKCRVECYEEENAKYSVAVEGDTLVIKVIDDRDWHDRIGFSIGSPKITVYLPAVEYGALSINGNTGNIELPKALSFGRADISANTGDVNFYAFARGAVKLITSTGNICVEDTSVDAIDLSVTTGRVTVSGVKCEGAVSISVSTGKAYLTDIACGSLTSNGTTGDIALKNVIAADKLSIERSTGNVTLDGADADGIFISTGTGNVAGSLLSDKVFIAQSNTGSVDVPKTASGDICKIDTDTGNIEIKIR